MTVSTSTEAHTDHELSDRAENNRQRCLALVRANPGLTAVELWSKQEDMNRHEVSRRLPELRQLGLVTSGNPRVCRVFGTRQMTWEPANASTRTTSPADPEGAEEPGTDNEADCGTDSATTTDGTEHDPQQVAG